MSRFFFLVAILLRNRDSSNGVAEPEAGVRPWQPGGFVFLRKFVHLLVLFAFFLATFARARDAGGPGSLRQDCSQASRSFFVNFFVLLLTKNYFTEIYLMLFYGSRILFLTLSTGGRAFSRVLKCQGINTIKCQGINTTCSWWKNSLFLASLLVHVFFLFCGMRHKKLTIMSFSVRASYFILEANFLTAIINALNIWARPHFWCQNSI